MAYKDKVICTFAAPQELWIQFKELSKSEGLTPSEKIRRMIKAELRKEYNTKK